MPQTDPKAGYLDHQAEIDTAIHRTLESGWYILGAEVDAFEQAFSTYIGCRHAIGVGNGTDALELALRACDVGVGDLVFTVSHTAVATVAATELVGATPVLVDIDPLTYTMDPNSLEAALSCSLEGAPKAIIPVHLYGHPANMTAILDLARRHNLYVIEDCAQSHGAVLDDRITGAWGDIAAFSFYPTKNLSALGDGGMVVTDDPSLADSVRSLQQYGWRERYVSELPGGNSRLDELQAAILRVKLTYLEAENTRRRKLAQMYTMYLADTSLILPASGPNVTHVYHQYTICLPQRDALRSHLKQAEIGTLIHYPIPIHLQPAYQDRLTQVVPLPHTERISQQILSLPMFPQMTEAQVQRVCQAINHFFRQ